ncbi:MAG: Hsp20/alpha crystallin family protein [Desulfatibacillaceae bacterium]
MTEQAKNTNLVAKEKQELDQPAEQTRPGRVFAPEVDIYEKEESIILLADMPGVDAGDLDVNLEDGVLTITGDVAPPEAKEEVDVFREYYTGRFFRQFTLSDTIDQARIEARVRNGVMELTLPKVQKAQPRKIEVQAG